MLASAASTGPMWGYAPPCISTRPSAPSRVATSMAYTMSSGCRPDSAWLGSADRIAMEVSDRTNTSRK